MKLNDLWELCTLLVLLQASLSSAQFCQTAAVPEDGRMFYSLATGEMKRCRKNFVYELMNEPGCGECGIIKYGYAMAEPCQADVEMTFENGKVADVRDATWIRSRDVTVLSGVEGSTDGSVAVFNGVSSYIEVPFFEYADIGARIEITLRYREDADPTSPESDQGLVSNSGQEDIVPTLAIVHSMSQNALAAALNTTGGIFKQFNVPLSEDMKYSWKTVTFDYNALASEERARLILDNPRRVDSDTVIGNIQALRTPLVIGKGVFADFFKGQIDYVSYTMATDVRAFYLDPAYPDSQVFPSDQLPD